MIDDKTLTDAVNIILDRILTPVLYMYADEAIEFICFADSAVDESVFRDTESALFQNLGIAAEILDIRNFDENDRVEITNTATLLYAEDDIVKMLFETSMTADKERMLGLKKEILTRKNETGTYYIN